MKRERAKGLIQNPARESAMASEQKEMKEAPNKEKLVAIDTLEEDDEFEEFENEGKHE